MTDEIEKEIERRVQEALSKEKDKPKTTKKQKVRRKLPKVVDREQIKAFLKGLQKIDKKGNVYYSDTNFREYTLYRLLLATGCRISEILGAFYDDIHPYNGNYVLLIRNTKNGDDIKVHIPNKLYKDILEISKRFRHNQKGMIFTTRKKTPLLACFIRRRTNELGIKAGIPFRTHPHCFRHTAATHFYEESGDIYKTADFLHHRNLASTMIYARINTKKTVKVIDDMHLYDPD